MPAGHQGLIRLPVRGSTFAVEEEAFFTEDTVHQNVSLKEPFCVNIASLAAFSRLYQRQTLSSHVFFGTTFLMYVSSLSNTIVDTNQ